MSLEWRDPPADRRVFSPDVVIQLRAHPGRWALIKSWPYHTGWSPKAPPADIELRYVYRKDFTELYARAKP